MGRSVVYIIEVEHCGEIGFGRACKEVEATVLAEKCVALLDNGLYGSEYKDIIISLGREAL
jgi:hypothetical protein